MNELTPEKSSIEVELQEESKKPNKMKKISKLDFIINLYRGLPGKEGDDDPATPLQFIDDLAKEVKTAEDKGYFRVRSSAKRERDHKKYCEEVKWYLTQAAKKGLIERNYKPRKKKQKPIVVE